MAQEQLTGPAQMLVPARSLEVEVEEPGWKRTSWAQGEAAVEEDSRTRSALEEESRQEGATWREEW